MRFLKFTSGGVFFAVIFSLAFYFGWNLADFSLESGTISASFERSVSNSKSLGVAYEAWLAKEREKNSEIRIILVGDVMLARGVANQIKKHGDFNYPFLNMADFLNSADLVFGNLEGPISDRGVKQGSVHSFRFDPKTVEALRWAGFDVVSIANNHILDYGPTALSDTQSYLEKNGIKFAGAGKNYEEANEAAILEVKSKKLAFLAYTNLLPKSLAATVDTPGISDFDVPKIKTKIEVLRKENDLVIVSMHWGEEYQAKANLAQKKIAREFTDAGADLMVGHHPHVPQEVEQYNQGWIFYSLGNFVFDQNFSEETMEGLVAEVKIKDGKIDSVEPIKIKINSTFQPQISE